ncbi:hypothetical protein ACFWXH_12930 [Mesorhizobium sp. NPDC059054]|uniref:hypothetical protein n=1 Tax=Mesorhizobium sp. NPDC059054 TaxID=3346711 RepID=UPI0036874748
MDTQPVHPDVFIHVRIIVGMVLGLSLTRLVTGLTRFVQHPARERIYPIHMGWVLFMFLAIIHFWWYEFGLSAIRHWTFELYLFVILYAVLFATIASLLFPDRMEEYSGYEEYFQSRRRWFYGFLALIFLVDMADTAFKGAEHFRSLGIEYPIRQTLFAICSIVAIFVASKTYQMVFVTVGLIYQISWILRLFNIMS